MFIFYDEDKKRQEAAAFMADVAVRHSYMYLCALAASTVLLLLHV